MTSRVQQRTLLRLAAFLHTRHGPCGDFSAVAVPAPHCVLMTVSVPACHGRHIPARPNTRVAHQGK